MKTEETRIIKRVGRYVTNQAYPEGCTKCGDAKFGTIIIDELCLDCLLDEVSREVAKKAYNEARNNPPYLDFEDYWIKKQEEQ